ncbi:MAG: outer membrane beta-barrel protein, partial [Proteobacteria bacterium]|nr:outer membrane beta-barrel protein [Pseudomonadota bacterium]
MLALLPAVALPAAAAEFIPSWDVGGVWNSNVFHTPSNEESDFSVRTGPTLRLRELQGDLTYDLNYQARYEAYARLNGISGIDSVDQYLSAQGAWSVTPNTTIEASNNFAYASDINSLLESNALTSTVVLGLQRITTNSAEATLTQRLGPLWSLSATVGNEFIGYQDPRQSNSTATTGTLQLTRGFTPRLV